MVKQSQELGGEMSTYYILVDDRKFEIIAVYQNLKLADEHLKVKRRAVGEEDGAIGIVIRDTPPIEMSMQKCKESNYKHGHCWKEGTSCCYCMEIA